MCQKSGLRAEAGNRKEAETDAVPQTMSSEWWRTDEGTSASWRIGECGLCTRGGFGKSMIGTLVATGDGTRSALPFSESTGEEMKVLEPAVLSLGEYGVFSSMSLMEMFVDSLSEKLSIESRRVLRCTNVGIVARPKPDFDLVKRYR